MNAIKLSIGHNESDPFGGKNALHLNLMNIKSGYLTIETTTDLRQIKKNQAQWLQLLYKEAAYGNPAGEEVANYPVGKEYTICYHAEHYRFQPTASCILIHTGGGVFKIKENHGFKIAAYGSVVKIIK